MSSVAEELLAPTHLANSFSHQADLLHYLVGCHFPNLLDCLNFPHFHLAHLLARPLHQATILLQMVIAPLRLALVNHQVVAAVLLFVLVDHQIATIPILFALTIPLMALTPLDPQLL